MTVPGYKAAASLRGTLELKLSGYIWLKESSDTAESWSRGGAVSVSIVGVTTSNRRVVSCNAWSFQRCIGLGRVGAGFEVK